MDKRHILLSVVLIFLISITVRSILGLTGSKQKIQRVEAELAEQQERNKSLLKEVDLAKKDDYIKKIAIEQLNMTNEGYRIVVTANNNIVSNSVNNDTKSEENKLINNAKKWINKLRFDNNQK